MTGVAAQYSGPSLFLSFILAGFVAMCNAFQFCELGSKIPCSGQAYTYIYVAYGEIPAWVVGWTLVLRFIGGSAALSRAWASYFFGFLEASSIELPEWVNAFDFLCF